jgi:cholesterol transport system auxiliary component
MKTALVIAAVLAASGCALTSKSDALDIRYFTPDAPALAAAPPNRAAGAELRLGRVTSGAGLHEKIAFSDGGHEVGYYDERRWTERPELYVRRALTRALYERRGLKHVVGGEAPTLDVDVVGFEEIKNASKHLVRVELRIQLSDDHAAILDATRTVERPVRADKKFDAVVEAMGEALDAASDQVAASVAAALEQRRAAPDAGRASAR